MSREDYIRVSARVRKSLGSSNDKVVFVNETAGISFALNENNEKKFYFDNVFPESACQESVFVQVGKRIIDGCLSGYNGTIFAYGQTGSGKTYTMFGMQNEDGTFKKNTEGLILRSMDYLLEQLNTQQEESCGRFSYSVSCSFVQLYNEGIYDLLDKEKANIRLKVYNDVKTKAVYVADASVEQIETIAEVLHLLRVGFQSRCVAETNMNRESSRSHAIFMVNVATRHVVDGVINNRTARLNLVDLAGSERQSDSKATGNQLKEANCINKSLSILTRVIRSLSKNPDQYPGYRDSPLTRLLQDSLGGNTRSTVIITLHPNRQFADTTLSTLNFSETVKRVKNNAKVNENIAGENVNALRDEIRRLREEYEAYKASSKHLECLESEVIQIKAALNEKTEQNAQLELELLRHKEALREAERSSAKLKAECLASGDRKTSGESSTSNADIVRELEKKCAAAEKRALVSEKRIADLEKANTDCKAALQKRENDVREYENTLDYKAKRLDNVRSALDDMHKKNGALEDECESLRRQLIEYETKSLNTCQQFQEAHSKFEETQRLCEEKEKALEDLQKQLKKTQTELDERQTELAELAGHHNTKQKISYVNALREKVAILETENTKLMQENATFRGSILEEEEKQDKQENTNVPNTRKRPALRSRGNSQVSAKVAAKRTN